MCDKLFGKLTDIFRKYTFSNKLNAYRAQVNKHKMFFFELGEHEEIKGRTPSVNELFPKQILRNTANILTLGIILISLDFRCTSRVLVKQVGAD